MPAEPFKFDGVLDEWKSGQIMRFCRRSALDIGCNTGDLVGFLNQRKIYAEGIDASGTYIANAREKHPHCVFHEGIDLNLFTDKQFESVVAWNVLEHIEDDRGALQQMMRIAAKNVILSVPKEDELSLPHSRVTYRPYVDPTHRHYYTREILSEIIGTTRVQDVYFEDTTRVRPMLAYEKLGIPDWLCTLIDNLFWAVGRNKELFHANLMVVISLLP